MTAGKKASRNALASIILLPLLLYAAQDSAQSGGVIAAPRDSMLDSVPAAVLHDTTKGNGPSDTSRRALETLGGNLPKTVAARALPYLVTSDLYVPSGRTVVIEPGAVLLFKNFTGLHVEGRLVAGGTAARPIVFSSEFDEAGNPAAPMHANPYDWNGIYIHESGLGSSLAHCAVKYSVYGVTSMTRYIKFDSVVFSNNGRADLTIEEKSRPVTAQPFSYALTVDDARKDGVPVAVLMDPQAKKRGLLRYGGLGLLGCGVTAAVWCNVQLQSDQRRVAALRETMVTDENSNLVKNLSADYDKAVRARDRDIGLTIASFIAAFIGGSGFGFSFTF